MPEKAIGTNTLPTIRNWVVSLIPTLTSQLTNDSDFITETDAETYIENAVRNAKNIWYGQCATAAGTLEKVVSTVSSSTNPFVWRKGSIIVVEFFNGVSGITQGTAVTLNVDGTGAKNVLLYTGELVYNGAWQPFETVIFAVDDTSFMMLGKARATTSSYGVTMLSSDTNSSSQLLAATPKAVKDALSAAKTYADGIGATIPTNTSDLTNDSGFITGMTILSYGHSTWSDFISAYNANKVVYARASSNADPGSGSQTRLAFMAYVDNATNPTFVEFQYYRSVSSHSVTQQGDQVYVYTLRSSGWSVITRENYTKIAAGTNMTQSYANGTLTLNATQPSVPQATSTTPLMDGTASVGSETTWAKGDHVHPSDTSKVDKETGKGLSTNDFTNTDKDKLDGIESGAQANVNADWNAVSGDAEILNKPTIPTIASASVTLVAADWSSQSQTVNVSGVTASNNVIVTYDPTSKADYTSADVYCSAQGDGTLTFDCKTTPSADISVNVLILS